MTKLQLRKIHEDERGKIYLILGDDLKEHEEITIFTCNKGYARGGCVHNINDESCCVLEGSIKYFMSGLKKPSLLIKGDSIVIPKKTPHYFIAQTDCVVIEWGATPTEKSEKHVEFRKKVDAINAEKKKMDNWMK